MRLDIDCVRNVLLALEKLTDMDESHIYQYIMFEDICIEIPNFSEKQIYHTLSLLYQAKYIEANKIDVCGGSTIMVETITWTGYELLDNLRSDQVLEKVKEIIKPFGTVSINIVSQLATKVISGFFGI